MTSEKQGDHRVLFLVLFLLLAFGIVTLFVARENLKQQSNQRNSRATQSQPADANETDADTDTDFGPYMATLQRRIKRSWFPPKNTESLRGKVVFKVHSDGSMTNLRMVTTTDLPAADQAMMKAVQNAAPFAALPPGAPADVDIEFTFDYNVFNSGSGRSTASPVE